MQLAVQGRIERGDFALQADVDADVVGVTALVGASGTGKSTLLRLIAGFEANAPVGVQADGEQWQGEGGAPVPAHRRAVGTVFQESRLFPHLTARGNLDFAARAKRDGVRLPFSEVVEFLDLGPLLDLQPHQLSGGQRQRVALGRTLLAPAKLWLFDEPMSALDPASRREIAPYLTALCRRHDVPIVYVSHSLPEVLSIAEQVWLAADGRVAPVDPGALGMSFLGPAAADTEAGAVIACRFERYDAKYGLSELAFEGATLYVPGDLSAAGPRILLHIPARDVSLSTVPVHHVSILNRVDGMIEATEATADQRGAVLVRVGRGEQHLLARVTQRSMDELGLHAGVKVQALIKSVALRTGL